MERVLMACRKFHWQVKHQSAVKSIITLWPSACSLPTASVLKACKEYRCSGGARKVNNNQPMTPAVTNATTHCFNCLRASSYTGTRPTIQQPSQTAITDASVGMK